jgi:lipoate-protein ligase A
MHVMPDWILIDTGPNTGPYNMALDQELLARAQAGERTPALRFYVWDPPAVSIGRFQKIASSVNMEACKEQGFDIVHRITGGRAVLHRKELTYSVTARSDDPLFPGNVLDTYKVLASGLVAGLRMLGLPAELVSRAGRHSALVEKKPKDPACFSSPSWYEVLVNGKKIAGSAQRRLSGAFLQHGSILIEYDPSLEAKVIPCGAIGHKVTCINRELGREVDVEEVKKAILRGFSKALGIQFKAGVLPAGISM